MITEQQIILLVKTLLLAWFFTNFEPIQDFFTKYVKTPLYKFPTYINLKLIKALSCFTCWSFWLTITATQDLFMSIGAAFIAYFVDRLINSLKIYIQ